MRSGRLCFGADGFGSIPLFSDRGHAALVLIVAQTLGLPCFRNGGRKFVFLPGLTVANKLLPRVLSQFLIPTVQTSIRTFLRTSFPVLLSAEFSVVYLTWPA